jgi:hypothetical protein
MTGLITDYTGRITSKHQGKPNFLASVIAACQPFVDAQSVTNQFTDCFDLDQAVGVQLDQIGLWLGVSRILSTPITGVFFSWDTPGLGWDQGLWLGPFAPTTNYASLDDSTYRDVLKLQAQLNNWNGSVGNLDAILGGYSSIFSQLFPGLAMGVVDNYDMSMTFQLYGSSVFGHPSVNGLTPIIQQLFLQGFFTPKPMAVSVTKEIWNGASFVTTAFLVSSSLTAPMTAGHADSSMAISGAINPPSNASGIHLELGFSPINPPADIANTTGSYLWQLPQTSSDSAGTFSSATFDLTRYDPIAPDTIMFLWGYDPVSGLLIQGPSIFFT